jgi:hypothetical protein
MILLKTKGGVWYLFVILLDNYLCLGLSLKSKPEYEIYHCGFVVEGKSIFPCSRPLLSIGTDPEIVSFVEMK